MTKSDNFKIRRQKLSLIIGTLRVDFSSRETGRTEGHFGE